MFTGIIEEVGMILDMKKAGSAMSLVIQSNKVTEDVKLGDSIAVNGVCLTVSFKHDIRRETAGTELIYGQADSVDSNAVAKLHILGHFVGLDD